MSVSMSVSGPSRRPAREAPADGAGVVLADYAGYPELARAAGLPVGAELFGVLSRIETAGLDAGGQIRLAVQWARLEAACCGHKIAAVAVVAGPEPTREQLAETKCGPGFTDFEVGAALHLGAVSAQRLNYAARALARQLTGVLGALRAGELGYLQALQYAEASYQLTPAQCARVEQLTLPKAAGKTPYELRRLLRRAVVRVGAEDFGKHHQQAKPGLGVRAFYHDDDGTGELLARLTAIDTKLVDAALDGWARAAKARGDERALDQLRAAGLVDLAERYLRGPNAPRKHGRPVTVNLTIDLPTFLGLTDHPGEILGTGQLVPAHAIHELIPDAALRRIITDPMTGQLLDYGRSTYRFPADAAAHAIATWVTSTGPGSTVAAEDTDIDHAHPWQRGGPTNPANANPCDRRWHRAKTIGNWTVRQADRTWIWRSPLGLEHQTTPHDYRLGP